MGIFPEMLVCGDITVTTLCTKLAMLSIRSVLCGSILHGNSYYTVIASTLVLSAASY